MYTENLIMPYSKRKQQQQQQQQTHVNNELLLAEIGNSLVISFMLFQ